MKEAFNNTTDKNAFSKERFFENHFKEKHKLGKDDKLFFLKQGDPVYMPSEGEEVITDPQSPFYEAFWKDNAARSKSIHYVKQYSGNRIYFIKHDIANPIIKGKEFGSQNAYEIIDGRSIKQYCIKLDVDRLGNIRPAK